MTDRLRIIIVDDHDVVRAGMRAILDSSFDIVGEADNVDSAIELIKERLPDLVVLDVKLPGGGGAAVIPAVPIRSVHAWLRALWLSRKSDAEIR